MSMWNLACVSLLALGLAVGHALPTASAVVDLRPSGTSPFAHFWKYFGSGHALLGTRVDWRAQLKLAVDEVRNSPPSSR